MYACRSFQDLPVVILLLIADNLDLQSLFTLIHTIPLAPYLGTAHMATQDTDKKTILHLLAEEHGTRIDLFETAVHKLQGSRLNTRDRFGRTPLSTAICFYKISMVDVLLKQPDIDVNLPDMHGIPPLQTAAIMGSTYLISMLLDHDSIDTSLPRVPGGQALATAARHALKAGQREQYHALLEGLVTQTRLHVDDRSHFNETLLSKAAEAGDATLVSVLLIMLDDDLASSSRTNPTRRPLLNVNAETHSGSTPLAYALFYGHTTVIQQLTPRPDINVNIQGFCRPPLTLAIEHGDTDAVKLLLARGADLDADALDLAGRAPLSYAAQYGHTAIVQLLLDRSDVDPNRVDTRRLSALLLAIGADHSDIVMMLLRRGDAVCCSFDLILHSPVLYCAVLEHPDWLALWPRCECLGCGYYHLNDPAYVSRPDWRQYVRDWYLR